MELTIREAHLDDAPGLAVLLGELGYPAETEAMRRRLLELNDRADFYVAVAEHDGVLLGAGAVHLYPAIQADGPGALITALVVSSTARGQGVGRRLVETLEQYARTNGCNRIIVTTANRRSDAHAFYKATGYEHTGLRFGRLLDQ